MAQVRLHALAVVLPIILSAQRALSIGLRLNVHQIPVLHLRYFCHEVYGTLKALLTTLKTVDAG
jgi:hypothetical protein